MVALILVMAALMFASVLVVVRYERLVRTQRREIDALWELYEQGKQERSRLRKEIGKNQIVAIREPVIPWKN